MQGALEIQSIKQQKSTKVQIVFLYQICWLQKLQIKMIINLRFIFTNSQQYFSFLYSEYSKPQDNLTEQQSRILTFFFNTIIPISGSNIAHIKKRGKNNNKKYKQYCIVQHFKVTSAVRYLVPPISLQDMICTNSEIMLGYKYKQINIATVMIKFFSNFLKNLIKNKRQYIVTKKKKQLIDNIYDQIILPYA
ncbi:hypothetical protein TTHERM_000886918 (macronuclear) [Tetrahymena thermophila SB210]|uniref:Uncharacterized protein n=1 Tax=Tetrahymena thermophila (strain SB210) TaxID=312017 RepID=W7XLN8_TETTS|nr:hypothetical protein TTHERM_000886918 [Tetrahymena thermophila SB210]EWS76614.1 hypothetical protein TTHERM_000886918 [Tetrahymena thermophila SB210]|eukprot:XP_012650900.1 hypothetical protein TTHERM_000886918 [Tetrahymena thermophila SB210]